MAHHVVIEALGRLSGATNGGRLAGFVSELLAGFYLGKVSAGDRLPPVREVAKSLHVSPTTALDLYRKLEDEGVVEARERSGIFLRRVGIGAERSPRNGALFELLGRTAKKLDLVGVSPADFSRLLLRYTGAAPQGDFKFGFLSHLESFQMIEPQFHKRLTIKPAFVVLSPDAAGEPEIRAQLARDRSIRCLLTTYLYSSLAFDLAKEFGLQVVVLQLDSTTARVLDPPPVGKRYIITRDRDCAAALRRLACAMYGERRSAQFSAASLDEPERLAEIDRDAEEVYASPLCIDRVTARYGPTKTVMVLPTDLSQGTLDDILFQYVFALDRRVARSALSRGA